MTGHVLRAQQELVLAAVAQASRRLDLGCANAWEVCRHLGDRAPQQNVVARRLFELAELGLVVDTGVERPGSSNRGCRCFRVSAEGNRWLVGAA